MSMDSWHSYPQIYALGHRYVADLWPMSRGPLGSCVQAPAEPTTGKAAGKKTAKKGQAA